MGRGVTNTGRFPEEPPHDGICLYSLGPHHRCRSKSKDHGIGFQFCDRHWDPSLIYRTQE